MSIGKALIKGAFSRLSQTMVSMAIAFFMMPFLVGDLGEKWYGVWATIGSLAAAYHLFDMGLAGAVTRYVALALANDDKRYANQIINTSLVIYLGIGALVFVISVLASSLLFLFPVEPADHSVVRAVILIIGAAFALEFPFNAFAGVASAKLRFHEVAVSRTIVSIINAMAIWAVVSRGYGVVAMATVTFATGMLSNLSYLYICKWVFPELSVRPSLFSRPQARELFGYSVWSFLIAATRQLRGNTDNLVIGYFISAAAVTHYFVGYRLVEYLAMLIGKTTASMLLPVFTRYAAKKDKAQLIEKTQFITRLNLAICFAAAVGLIFVGDDFIRRWMGAGFEDSYEVMIVLLAGSMLNFSTSALNSSLYATNKHRVNALFGIAEVVLNIAISIYLVQEMGIIGVAYGTLIPLLIIRILVYPVYALRAIEISSRDYYVAYLRPTLAFAVPLGLAAWYTGKIALDTYLDIVVGGGLTGVAVGAIAFAALNSQEREKFYAVFRNRAKQ